MSLRKEITKFLTRDWWLKILALLLGFSLWFYVQLEDKVQFQREVPITNIPSEVKVYPKQVLVVGWIVEKLNKEKYLDKIHAVLLWDGKNKFARVEIVFPFPKFLVSIETVYPREVKVEKEN
ncbi:MAG: hypothetical protein GXN97_02160 [Aquificae bacterium]|nr:hypothetical protein [Aquificota bacterium]